MDDCFQVENLRTIIKTAYAANQGKLTIFPIGQNLSLDGMKETLQTCVFQLGYEIENHTWSHARIFRLSELEMAAEIWKQHNAVCQALGVNYEPHFFRFMGGDGEHDQRSHNYLKQLGYFGIANWSISGSDASMEQIVAAMEPGAIYLFHTTDADTAKLEQFIPYAVSQGYTLVTLNAILGVPENTWTDISTAEYVMPTPRPYTVEYIEQKVGDYSWSVVLIQQKLYELGYLAGDTKSAVQGSPADGVFGQGTAEALRQFQTDRGLPATGIADPETQRQLLGA